MVHEGLKKVLGGVAAAAQAAGRAPEAVTLIAVSKTFEAPEIVPVKQRSLFQPPVTGEICSAFPSRACAIRLSRTSRSIS